MQSLSFIAIIFLLLSCEDKQGPEANNAPVANDITIVTDENVSIEITLAGSDAEGGDLIFEIIEYPLYGTLDGELPTIIYTPNTNFSGNDSFSYHVSDGVTYSEVATVSITVLPNLAGLFINEFLASNSAINMDEVGEYDDWLELYNAGNISMDLGGFFLTDNLENLTKWEIPEETVISDGGFLLVWCDEDQEQGSLHTNFRLSADGEFIALVSPDGLSVVDSLSFGPQTNDLSYGRTSDGNSVWDFFNTPTPNSPNGN